MASRRVTAPQANVVVGAVVLAAILVAALVIRVYRIDEPIAGYFAFSEGLYMQRAAVEAARGPFAWFTDPAFPNVFPLYHLVVTLLDRVGSLTIATARGVSTAAGLLAVGAVFSLGRRLYSQRAGLFAAAALAFIPGMVLLNHNAQVDSLMVGLLTLTVALYAAAALDESPRRAVLAGVVGGFAIMAKLPATVAIIVLIGWDWWRTGEPRTVIAPRNMAFALSAAAVGLPWYAWQTLSSAGAYTSTMSTLGERATGGAVVRTISSWLVGEPLGFFSPLVVLVLVGALLLLSIRRESGDKLVVLWLAAYVAFYLLFHFHSYYLLPLAPGVALGLGAAGDALVDRWGTAGVVAAAMLVVYMVFASTMMLAGQKWGAWSPVALNEIMPELGVDTVYVTERVRGTLGPATELYADSYELCYLPAGAISPAEDDPLAGSALILGFPLVNSAGIQAPSVWTCKDEQVRLVVFGRAFWQSPDNGQLFANGEWQSARVGATWDFGLESVPKSSQYLLYDPGAL